MNMLLDSRVTIGSQAKGRSSSRKLRRGLRGDLPYVLGGNLYLGFHFAASRLNPADDPTRDVPLRAPVRPLPQWLSASAGGELGLAEEVMDTVACNRPLSQWRLLLCRLMMGRSLRWYGPAWTVPPAARVVTEEERAQLGRTVAGGASSRSPFAHGRVHSRARREFGLLGELGRRVRTAGCRLSFFIDVALLVLTCAPRPSSRRPRESLPVGPGVRLDLGTQQRRTVCASSYKHGCLRSVWVLFRTSCCMPPALVRS